MPNPRLCTLRMATLLLIISTRLCNALSSIQVSTTAPVNPVEDNGILSLHCQVWKAIDSHEVTIFRTLITGETQRLSVNDNVLPDVDERIYLGVRKAIDGSTIYFLSIIGVTRQDIGEYICKVFRVAAATVVEVAGDSVNITSTYLPPDPVCTPGKPLTVYVGSLLTLNCSSEVGFPPVTMEWTRTGTTEPLNSHQITHGKIIHRQLSLRMTPRDNNAIFICLTSSRAYPNMAQSCHVGPINVLPMKGNIITTDVTTNEMETVKGTSVTKVSVLISTDDHIRQRCLKTCASKASLIFYWIIATTIAGILALLFLVLGIYLLVRYLKLSEEQQGPSEKIYSELEAEQMLYMSLQKQVRHTTKERDYDYGR